MNESTKMKICVLCYEAILFSSLLAILHIKPSRHPDFEPLTHYPKVSQQFTTYVLCHPNPFCQIISMTFCCTDYEKDQNSGLDAGATTGIVIAAIFSTVIFIAICLCCCWCRRQARLLREHNANRDNCTETRASKF